MKAINLKAQTRSKDEVLSELRASRLLPAVTYGKGIESAMIKLDYTDFLRVFRESGESHTINLDIDGIKTKVLVHDIQYHPVSDEFVHVDFYVINENEPVHTNMAIIFENKSPAESLGAIIEHTVTSLEVKCLPKDLVDGIPVDLAELKEIGDSIHLSDIKLPSGIEVLHLEDNATIVSAQAPRVAQEEDTGAPVDELPENVKEDKE